MPENSLRLLGLAKKAGRLEAGADASSAAADAGRAAMSLSASDASERAQHQAMAMAERCGAVFIPLPYTGAELGGVIGRGCPVTVAVTDPGLAAAFAKALAEEDGRFREYAEALERASSAHKEKQQSPGRGVRNGKRR